MPKETHLMETVLVNRADWRGGPPLPENWLIANAPRPLDGTFIWVGDERHGRFYAAARVIVTGPSGWKADGAKLIEFIDNDEILRRIHAALAVIEIDDIEQIGPVAELAAFLGFPWHQ